MAKLRCRFRLIILIGIVILLAHGKVKALLRALLCSEISAFWSVCSRVLICKVSKCFAQMLKGHLLRDAILKTPPDLRQT